MKVMWPWRTQWRLFQERVVQTKFDIYVVFCCCWCWYDWKKNPWDFNYESIKTWISVTMVPFLLLFFFCYYQYNFWNNSKIFFFRTFSEHCHDKNPFNNSIMFFIFYFYLICITLFFPQDYLMLLRSLNLNVFRMHAGNSPWVVSDPRPLMNWLLLQTNIQTAKQLSFCWKMWVY